LVRFLTEITATEPSSSSVSPGLRLVSWGLWGGHKPHDSPPTFPAFPPASARAATPPAAAGPAAAGITEAARRHAAGHAALGLAEDALAGLRGPLRLRDDHAGHDLLIDLAAMRQQFAERAVGDAKPDVDLLQLRRSLRRSPCVDGGALFGALHGLEELVDLLRVQRHLWRIGVLTRVRAPPPRTRAGWAARGAIAGACAATSAATSA